MIRLLQTHVEVHTFRRRGWRTEFLCLRRAAGRRVLPGAWQPVTGKRRRGERAAAAALRELREETGLVALRLWALESPIVYFDAWADAVRLLPVFAAEVPADSTVTLSREHDAYAWLSAARAGRRFVWEAQRHALAALRREVIANRRLARVLELPAKTRGTGVLRRGAGVLAKLRGSARRRG